MPSFTSGVLGISFCDTKIENTPSFCLWKFLPTKACRATATDSSTNNGNLHGACRIFSAFGHLQAPCQRLFQWSLESLHICDLTLEVQDGAFAKSMTFSA